MDRADVKCLIIFPINAETVPFINFINCQMNAIFGLCCDSFVIEAFLFVIIS